MNDYTPRTGLTARAGSQELRVYFGGDGGEKISRLRPGSGFGFGLGAFFASFLPLSLLPMRPSMTQKTGAEKPFAAGRFQFYRRNPASHRPGAAQLLKCIDRIVQAVEEKGWTHGLGNVVTIEVGLRLPWQSCKS